MVCSYYSVVFFVLFSKLKIYSFVLYLSIFYQVKYRTSTLMFEEKTVCSNYQGTQGCYNRGSP